MADRQIAVVQMAFHGSHEEGGAKECLARRGIDEVATVVHRLEGVLMWHGEVLEEVPSFLFCRNPSHHLRRARVADVAVVDWAVVRHGDHDGLCL